jgi:hypothetical protein
MDGSSLGWRAGTADLLEVDVTGGVGEDHRTASETTQAAAVPAVAMCKTTI